MNLFTIMIVKFETNLKMYVESIRYLLQVLYIFCMGCKSV